jgi:hypothetical protein
MALSIAATTTNKIENYTTPGDVTGHRGHAQQRNRERPKERRPEGLRGHSCHQRQEESEDDARRRALPQVHLLTHFIMVSVPISRISNRLGQMPPRSLT